MPFTWPTDLLRLIMWFAVDSLAARAALQRVNLHFNRVASHHTILSQMELSPKTPDILQRALGVCRVAFTLKIISESGFYSFGRNGRPVVQGLHAYLKAIPPSVHTLRFECEKLVDLRDLQHPSGLRTLHLSHFTLCYGLERLTQLKHLFVDGEIDCGRFLARCQTLCELETLKLPYLRDAYYRQAHHVLNYIDDVVKLTTLRTLAIPIHALGDEGLRRLAALPNLTSLNVSRSSITDAGLDMLASLPNLRTVNVSGCTRTSADGLAKLCASLTVVH